MYMTQKNVQLLSFGNMGETVALIQGVTGGMCETSGECSLGQTIPI
jgi:hypothetical protein